MWPKNTNSSNKPTARASSNRASPALIIALIIAISWIAWLTQVDQVQKQEHFSEFYIKDSAVLLRTNSLELTENEESSVYAVIVNHEGTNINYRIHILRNGNRISTVENIYLASNESAEKQIRFSFPTTGDNQSIDILLEKQGSMFPYRTLRLIVNVLSKEKNVPQ